MSETETKTAQEHFQAATAVLKSPSEPTSSEEHPNAVPEEVSETDFKAALEAAGAHLGPPTPAEERAAGKRIDLTPEEQAELTALAARIAKKRALFMDQILVAAAQMKLLEDNYAFRVQELAGEHKLPEGWVWSAAEMCFKPRS